MPGLTSWTLLGAPSLALRLDEHMSGLVFASLTLARSLMRLYVRAGDPTIVFLLVNNAALSDRLVRQTSKRLHPLNVCNPDEHPSMLDHGGPADVDYRCLPVAWFR